MITDAADGSNTTYFKALAGTTSTSIVVDTGGDGIPTSYSGSVSKVQILREADPDDRPVSYFNSVDSIVRYGIKSIVNQIDYSS